MADETIVAVFDTEAHADLAVRDLLDAGVAESSISKHAGTSAASATDAPLREQGFWSRLFGGEPDQDSSVYDRSLQGGSTVVTIRPLQAHVQHVVDILDRHSPVDLDERAAAYGLSTSTTATDGMDTTARKADSDAATLRLSEERLIVGKRLVNLGGTRIRRFVVETPVEQQVSLHEEKVILERRPVAGTQPVMNASFTDKTIEMTQSAEEAVIAKNTYVTEEISLRKQATDRVETIRDTVRREDVEVEQIPGSAAATPAPSTTTPAKPYDRKI